MVVALEPIRRAMNEAKKNEKGDRETGNYRLYRETMDKVVEIAAHKKVSVAALVEPMLAALVDAEYMVMLNDKMQAENDRRKRLEDAQNQKRGKR
jgi:hypothetical protein